MTLTITLPLPDRALSPNGRAHPMAKARVVKRARALATFKTLAATGCAKPKHERATLQLDWYARTKMFPDSGNAAASMKAYEDGIVSAGFLKDDRYLTPLPPRFHVDKQSPRVVLTITPEE